MLLASILQLSCFSQNSVKVSGYVFNDSKQNGIFDNNETGVPGVLVSNQREVVRTNNKGMYSLPIPSEAIIFASKPSWYGIPLNELNLPQFYYIHQPEGSPEGLAFNGIAPSGKLPGQVNFQLIKITEAKVHDMNFLKSLDLISHSMIVFDKAHNYYHQFAV